MFRGAVAVEWTANVCTRFTSPTREWDAFTGVKSDDGDWDECECIAVCASADVDTRSLYCGVRILLFWVLRSFWRPAMMDNLLLRCESVRVFVKRLFSDFER